MNTPKRPFDQVLSECVQAVLIGDATITSCMERFPEHADKLAQLLPQVQSIRGTALPRPTLNPPPGSHDRFPTHSPAPAADGSLWNRIRSFFMPSGPRTARRRSGLTWALIGSMLIATLGVGGVGAAYAADGASPRQPLYGIDQAIESARIALTLDAVSQAELALAFAQERVTEAETLAAEDKSPAAISQAAAEYEANVQQAASALAEAAALGDDGRAEALQSLVVLSLSVHEARLSEVADRVPEKAAVAIRDAVQASQAALQPIDTARPGLQGDRVPEGAGAPDGAGRPENAGPPEGTEPPNGAGQPEDTGPSVETLRPERAGTPDAAGPPEETGNSEDVGPPGDAPGQGE